MIPQWDLIPKEILLNIFEYVREEGRSSPRSLAECALTCRLWRLSAHEVYFKSIHVFGRKDLIKARDILTKRPNSDCSLGMLVKEIYYAFDHITFEEDIQLIDTLFPRLERSYYENYGVKEPRQVFKAILAGGFMSLQEAPTFDNFDVCDIRKNDFSIIDVDDHGRRMCLYKSRYDELYKRCVLVIEERKRVA